MTTLRNSETGIEFVGPVTNKLRETETGIEFVGLKPIAISWQLTGATTGAVIPTGPSSCAIAIPFACTLTGWIVQANPAATMTFNLWRNNAGHSLPTVANSLGLSFGPTAHQVDSGTFGSPIALAAGDNLVLTVLSNDLATDATITLLLTR